MKYLIKKIIITLIALGVGLGLWMYMNGFLTKSKANQETATVSFAPATRRVNDGDEASVNVLVNMTGGATLSGVDLSFTTTGDGLEFKRYILPTGFTEELLDIPKTISDAAPKKLLRLVFVAATKTTSLPHSATIPLYFTAKVPNGNRAATPQISVDVKASQAVGMGGVAYQVALSQSEPSFKVGFNPPPSDSATSLECATARNQSLSGCGQNVSITWTDAINEDGYRISRNGTLLQTISKNSISYTDPMCNFAANTYTIQAFNAGGVNANPPTVTCTCQVCPTKAPPSPSPVPPPGSADLMFHAVFPDAASNINQISDVKVTVFDRDGKSICNDGMDCRKIVTFQRDLAARMPNTFNSPRLSYEFEKNQAYTFVVKQNHTVKQTYKRVYLTWKDVLQCFEGTQDSRCGDLIGDVTLRPLFSGDLDGSNKIDQADLDTVSNALGLNGAEGDLNFDGKTDQKDVNIVSKNFGKSGI